MEKLKRHANTDLPDPQIPVPPPKKANANAIESSALETSILDLNDDCLREVFEHFSLDDLCAVADVCCRFKRIAQESYKPSKHKVPEFPTRYRISDEEQLKRVARVLRNFGAYIDEIRSSDIESQQYRNRFLELVTRYCSEKLVSLHLHYPDDDFTEELAHSIRPVLRYLEKLDLRCYEFKQMFLEVLPIWSPNLRELQLHCDRDADQIALGLHQKYPKLERVKFANVDIDDIEEFLKRNPQLKEYSQAETYGLNEIRTLGHIFQLIAAYTPKIVKLTIDHAYMKEFDRKSIKYLSELSALKSLHFDCFGFSSTYFPLSEIDFANIPLEDLNLACLDFRGETIKITQLKKLKSLTLSTMKGLPISHIIDICKQCTELSHLCLNSFSLTVDDLLEIIQHAQKLHSFEYSQYYSNDWVERYRYFIKHGRGKITIDVGTYKKIANMVRNRAHKLTLKMGSGKYESKLQIPEELIESHKKWFNLKIFDER